MLGIYYKTHRPVIGKNRRKNNPAIDSNNNTNINEHVCHEKIRPLMTSLRQIPRLVIRIMNIAIVMDRSVEEIMSRILRLMKMMVI